MSGILNAEKIARIIAASDDIVISAHTGPDGDAIGSVAALLLALRKMGKTARAVLETMPRKYADIEGARLIEFSIDGGVKTFIALDCADLSRLGRFKEQFGGAELSVNIDHHASNGFFGMYNFVDENASAASEMVYDVIMSMGVELDREIASALYAGILYDTGGFRHTHTTGRTYFIAGNLIEHGADFHGIYKRMFYTRRLEEIKVLSLALAKMKCEFDGRLVWTSVTSEELEREGALKSELDGVVEYCKSVEGSKIAVFIYQKDENEFKISLRGEPEYDVSAVAARFGGGGHRCAAGSTYFGTLDKCREDVFKEIKTFFDEV